MLLTRKHFIHLAGGLLLLASCSVAQSEFPPPQGMVSDFSGKLSQSRSQGLEKRLGEFADHSGIEIAVVLIPFEWLQGDTIENYARKMGQQWGVGRGPQKLGLVLLVAIKPPDDKGIYSGQTRLEVSGHLEQDIPNELAEVIIRGMRVELKAGRFDDALETGVEAIITELRRKRNIAAAANKTPGRSANAAFT